MAHESSTTIVMMMMSCLACFYVAGRLWEDAKVRTDIMELAKKRGPQPHVVEVDDTIKMIDSIAQKKRIAQLEMEIAAAKAKGYKPEIQNAARGHYKNGRLKVVIGINTAFANRNRREAIRNTWMGRQAELKRLEEEKGVIIRFVIGRSANRGDSSDKVILRENEYTNDFIILLSGFQREGPRQVCYDSLLAFLEEHSAEPRVYAGCMKSGEVYTKPEMKWYEPESWKFGDQKSYLRHATGQIYVLSKALAEYIHINSAILHKFKNEDVTLGTWMIGLDAQYVDERRLCCASQPNGEDCAGRRAAGKPCIAVYDWPCTGLCKAAERMQSVHEKCG
ncbi:GT31-family glycosyltransferase [Chara braunii]|uniref:Hexosyltransferase n=1 Tax=Chara braunii TaxID=69332 RepID=A0A388L1C7_CHABU|nr:GT31-family glycosyltransferase [Chara braunii]|eukprot:GBG76105.1 GT31-family glycosyltransferase [Chara braunii]